MRKMQDKAPFLESSPETELLLALALNREAGPLPEEFRGERFRYLLEKSRLGPLVAGKIQKNEALLNRAQGLKKIAAESSGYALRCMRQIAALAETMEAFSDSGIRALSVKGPLLAKRLYGNPALRFSKDVDILVDPRSYETAKRRLAAMGWREVPIPDCVNTPRRRQAYLVSGYHAEFWRGGTEIELHWCLTDDVPAWSEAQDAFERIWDERKTAPVSGKEIAYWDEDEYICYLIYHTAKHHFYRLRWLMDLYLIIRNETEIGRLYAAAQKLGIERMLLETLLLLTRIRAFDLREIAAPLFVIRRTADGIEWSCDGSLSGSMKWACRSSEYAWNAISSDSGLKEGYFCYCHKRCLKKQEGPLALLAGYFCKRLQPGVPEWSRFDLPDRLYFLYYLIKPVNCICKRLRSKGRKL